MTHLPTGLLLDRYLGVLLGTAVPVGAVWVHGSFAAGDDYRPGRSDIDVVTLLARPCTAAEEKQLGARHAELIEGDPQAAGLHVSYVPAGQVADPAHAHLRWAHQELKRAPVTPVTRRELHDFGQVRYGSTVASALPPVSDAQLADFVAADLAGFWRPALGHPLRWRQDIWVDLGMLTLARARVTLATGRLITKAEAFGVLAELGAPAEVVADIRRRRYDEVVPAASRRWRVRRAALTREFLGPAIERVLGGHAG